VGTAVPTSRSSPVRDGLYVPEGPDKKDPLKQVLSAVPTSPCRKRRTTRVYGRSGRALSAATCSARCRSAGWSGRSCSCRSSRCRRFSAAAGPNAAAVPDSTEPGAAQRPGDPDDRRGPALDNPAETSSGLYMNNYNRPSRLHTTACANFQKPTTAGRSAGSFARGASSPATAITAAKHLPDDRWPRRAFTKHAVRGHARRGAAAQRRTTCCRRCSTRCSRDESAPHQQRLRPRC